MNVTSEMKLICKESLQSYSTVYDLYMLLREQTEDGVFKEIYTKYASDISSVFDYFDNESRNPEYNSHLSVLELQAIMLRLSRHHIKRAKTIENVSQFLKEILEYHTDINNEPFPISFYNAEFIDRPSLMILNRLLRIIKEKDIKAEVKFHFNRDVLNSTESSNIIAARVQVFNKLERLNDISIFSSLSEKPLTSKYFTLEEKLYNKTILDSSIIEQNFELAFQILNESVKSHPHKKVVSDQIAYRNLGVIEANLGNFAKALDYFNEAITNSETVVEVSRNSYIKGLCLIKRLKRVEEGLEVINEALKLLDKHFVDSSVKYMHEKAWLINGLCLGQTILASKMNNEEKNKEFFQIIQTEMEAYRLISKESSFRLIYLKFNLLANIAFLLEIQGEYEKAINFWERSFAPILANDGDFQEGEKSLTYRLGILKIHLNEYRESEDYLVRCLQLARNENNSFHLNVVIYALGYLKLLQGHNEEALTYLNEGYKISSHLGDLAAKTLFIKGIQSCNESALPKEDLEKPKVKLTSYIPYIDLSFVPEIDLNKALTSEGGNRSE